MNDRIIEYQMQCWWLNESPKQTQTKWSRSYWAIVMKYEISVKRESGLKVKLQVMMLFGQQRYTTKPTAKGPCYLQDCSSLTCCEFIVASRSKELIVIVVSDILILTCLIWFPSKVQIWWSHSWPAVDCEFWHRRIQVYCCPSLDTILRWQGHPRTRRWRKAAYASRCGGRRRASAHALARPPGSVNTMMAARVHKHNGKARRALRTRAVFIVFKRPGRSC